MKFVEMQSTIFTLAMYEIVQMIRKTCPTYHFSKGAGIGKGQRNQLVDRLFKYTDKLDQNFPAINANTYSMIVCGTIMHIYVSGLHHASSIDGKYFTRLESRFADEKTKSYFEHIFWALEEIELNYHENEQREIIKWPNDYTGPEYHEDRMGEFYKEVLAAISDKPEYSYAYSLLLTPHMDSLDGIVINISKKDLSMDVRNNILKSHKYMGENLFRFLRSGFFSDAGMVASVINFDSEPQEVIFSPEIEDYAKKQGYTLEEMDNHRISGGYFHIENQRYPAGIPFYRCYMGKDYSDFKNSMFHYIPEEEEGFVQLTETYTDEGINLPGARLVYNQYAVYGGFCFFMPKVEATIESKEFTTEIAGWRAFDLLGELLDTGAKAVESMEEKQQELEKAYAELEMQKRQLEEANHVLEESKQKLVERDAELTRQTDQLVQAKARLDKHVEMNQQLIRGISHASANYLNSEVLAKYGNKLEPSDVNKVKNFLILQSANETFMRNSLDALVIRGTANYDTLRENLRTSLEERKDTPLVSVEIPLEYALRTILSRILLREKDIRSEEIRLKMLFLKKKKEKKELLKKDQKKDFLEIIIKDEPSMIKFCKDQHLCTITRSISDIWEKVFMQKEQSFYDLLVEILTEQLFNAMSHGDLNQPIEIDFGQKNEEWCYIACRNSFSDETLFKGGHERGLASLDYTLRRINEVDEERKEGGVSREEADGNYICTAWIGTDLLKPQEQPVRRA